MTEITESKRVYSSEKLKVDEVTVLQDGDTQKREIVRHSPGVSIVVLRSRGGETAQGYEVIMIQQFRAPAEKELIELVAGIMDEGETPLEAAKRELREETGLEANNWVELGTLYASPGYVDEQLTLFLARDTRYVGDDPDDTENLRLCAMPFTLALESVKKGEIQDLKTAAGLFWASLYLSEEMSA
jgi:ADP-ribose pyrophosphatase